MLLEVGIDGTNNTCIALLDSGAAVNVMAEHVYRKFVVNPLTPTTIQLNTASNQAIACKGMVMVSTSIGEHKEECHFHVTDTKESAHDIILGRSWMHKHKCQFDWDKRTITVVLCNQRVVLPVAAEATSTTEATPLATSVATAVPTRKRTNNHAKKFATTKVVSTKASIHKWWLPKKLLQAQHFYEENNLIWIPKQRQTSVNAGFIHQDSQQVRKVIPQTRWLPQAHNFYQKNNYNWVPKATQPPITSKTVSNLNTATQMLSTPQSDVLPISSHTQKQTEMDTEKQLQQGKGKQTTEVPYSQAELDIICQSINDLPSSSIYLQLPQLHKQAHKVNIQQRALLLQCKLFGRSSLPSGSQVVVN